MKIPFLILGMVALFSFKTPDQNNVFRGAPQINEPSVVGNYPNTPFLFAIPTSGQRPIKWAASSLPKGLVLNSSSGFITGNVKVTGDYKIQITTTNKLGKDEKTITIKIGDLLALTPPMGWNSWNTFTR